MILILEGPDCSGKTTLANELQPALDATIVHHGPFKEDESVLSQVLGSIETARQVNENVIFDRLHIGERVYGPVYRHSDRLGPAGQRMIERALLGVGEVGVIMTRPPVECIVDAWLRRKDEEMLNDLEQLKDTILSYDAQRTHLPSTVFDYTQHSVESVLDALGELLSPKNHGPGIGAWRPGFSTLIIGDKVNRNEGYDLPFIGTGGCSPWLCHQLDLGGIPEYLLYWVNARRPDGVEEDPGFIERLDPRGIIALGAMAAEWVERSGLLGQRDYTRLDHPQYHKRFYHHDPYPLAEAIHDLRS